MRQISLLIIFLFLTTICYSQVIIKGEIKNTENNEPIPYVNIGVFEKKVGTVSNDSGFFNLKLNESVSSSDTVTFSSIGFKSKKIPISNLKQESNIIFLEHKTEELKDVIVLANSRKTEIIGREKEGGISSKFFSPFDENINDRLSREQGMIFKIKNSGIIQDVNFHISLNEFKRVKLRLIFYKVENGLPLKPLNKDDIIIDIEDQYLGWFKINLENYDITLDKSFKEIAVTLQWLESEKETDKSERFGITAVNSFKRNALFREKGMDKWAKWKQTLSLYMNMVLE